MSRYASRTDVSADRSRQQIERELLRFGAEEFGYLSRLGRAYIMFRYRGLGVQLSIPLPARDDDEFTTTPTGKDRSEAAAFAAWEAETKRRWRSLCLVIKALLVAVDDGVFTFEEAFLAHLVWGDGKTTAQQLLPTVQAALEGRKALPRQLEVLP